MKVVWHVSYKHSVRALLSAHIQQSNLSTTQQSRSYFCIQPKCILLLWILFSMVIFICMQNTHHLPGIRANSFMESTVGYQVLPWWLLLCIFSICVAAPMLQVLCQVLVVLKQEQTQDGLPKLPEAFKCECDPKVNLLGFLTLHIDFTMSGKKLCGSGTNTLWNSTEISWGTSVFLPILQQQN